MKNVSYLRPLYFLYPLLLFLFSYSVQAQKVNLNYPSADNDLKLAKATVEAYEAQNWEGLQGYLSPDAHIFGLASFSSLNVDQTITYWRKGSETASPELSEETWLTVSFPEGIRKGNWVHTWGTNTLTYASGAKISFPYHLALKISDSKVQEAHFYYDNYKIIREMGYAISPPLEDDPLEEGIEGELERTLEKN